MSTSTPGRRRDPGEVRLLLRVIEGEDPASIVLPTALVERDSTAAKGSATSVAQRADDVRSGRRRTVVLNDAAQSMGLDPDELRAEVRASSHDSTS